MVDAKEKEDTLPEHSSTAELVEVKDGQAITADQALERCTDKGF